MWLIAIASDNTKLKPPQWVLPGGLLYIPVFVWGEPFALHKTITDLKSKIRWSISFICYFFKKACPIPEYKISL